MGSTLRSCPSLGLCAAVALAASCITPSGGGSGDAPFQGLDSVTARIKQIDSQITVANPCLAIADVKEARGVFEATADASGKMIGRTMMWQGPPAVEACVIAAIAKATVPPLAGPSVSTFWHFAPPGDTPPPPPDTAAMRGPVQNVQSRLQPEIDSCAQRHLAPDFPADVTIAFSVFPGGKLGGATVIESTAKDGGYERCVQQVVGGTQFPDPGYPGRYPLKLSFHVGLSSRM